MTNEQRAERGRRALDYYAQYKQEREDFETDAIDLMADLLHVIEDQTGTHAEDAHRMAWHHYVAERAEERTVDA